MPSSYQEALLQESAATQQRFSALFADLPKEKPRGFIAETASALGQGIVATGEGIAGTAEMFGVPGAKPVREYLQEVGENPMLKRPDYLQEGDILSNPERLHDWRWWTRSLGENLPNMAAMMLPGVAARNIALNVVQGGRAVRLAAGAAKALSAGEKAIVRASALTGSFAGSFSLEAGGAYTQAKQEMEQSGTYDPDTIERVATMEGLTAGTANALIELLPFDNLFLKQAGADRFLKRIARQTFLEGGTEAAQEAVNIYVEKLGHKPDQDLFNQFGRILESAVIGGAMGGVAGGTVGTVEHRSNVRRYNAIADQLGVTEDVATWKTAGMPDAEIAQKIVAVSDRMQQTKATTDTDTPLTGAAEINDVAAKIDYPLVDADTASDMVSYLLYGDGKFTPEPGPVAKVANKAKRGVLGMFGMKEKTAPGKTTAETAEAGSPPAHPELVEGPAAADEALTVGTAQVKDIALKGPQAEAAAKVKKAEVKKEGTALLDLAMSEPTAENEARLEQAHQEEVARKDAEDQQAEAAQQEQAQTAINSAQQEQEAVLASLAGDDPEKRKAATGALGLSDRVALSTAQKVFGWTIQPTAGGQFELTTPEGPQPIAPGEIRKALAQKQVQDIDAARQQQSADQEAIQKRDAESRTKKEQEQAAWALDNSRQTLQMGTALTPAQLSVLNGAREQLTPEETAKLDTALKNVPEPPVQELPEMAAEAPAAAIPETPPPVAEPPAAIPEAPAPGAEIPEAIPAPPSPAEEMLNPGPVRNQPEPDPEEIQKVHLDLLADQVNAGGVSGRIETATGVYRRTGSGGWISAVVKTFNRQSTTPLADEKGAPKTLPLSKAYLGQVIAKAQAGETLTDQQDAVYQEILKESGAEQNHAREIIQSAQYEQAGFQPVPDKTVAVKDLVQGDALIIGGEDFRVTDIDEAGNVTMKDGTIRTVKDGDVLKGVDFIKQQEPEFKPEEKAAPVGKPILVEGETSASPDPYYLGEISAEEMAQAGAENRAVLYPNRVQAEATSDSKAELPGPQVGAADNKVRDGLNRLMERRIKLDAAEAQGQDILATMDETNRSPQDAANEFWDKTYWNLSGKDQVKFQKQVQRLTGQAPGSTLWYNPDTKEKGIAKDWIDVAKNHAEDLPATVEHLEGTERGYVSLMEYMNQKVGMKEPAQTAKSAASLVPVPAKTKSAVSLMAGAVSPPAASQQPGEMTVPGDSSYEEYNPTTQGWEKVIFSSPVTKSTIPGEKPWRLTVIEGTKDKPSPVGHVELDSADVLPREAVDVMVNQAGLRSGSGEPGFRKKRNINLSGYVLEGENYTLMQPPLDKGPAAVGEPGASQVVGMEEQADTALPVLRETPVPVPDDVFARVGVDKGNVYADYEALRVKHADEFPTTQDVQQHVEYVMENPTDILAASKPEYTLLVRENGGDKAAVVEFELKGGKYRVHSAYTLDEGQLAIKKQKAQRGVSEPGPANPTPQGPLTQGGGAPSDALHVEPSIDENVIPSVEEVKGVKQKAHLLPELEARGDEPLAEQKARHELGLEAPGGEPLPEVEPSVKYNVTEKTEGVNLKILSPDQTTSSRPPARGLTADKVTDVTAKVSSSLKNPPKINIVQNTAELPVAVLDIMSKQGILDDNMDSDVKGLHWEGEIWMVANNHAAPQAVVHTLAHELTHNGVGKFLRAQDNNRKIRSVRLKYGSLTDAIYRAHKSDVDAIAATTHTHLDTKTLAGQRQAAEEWLANQSYETQPKWYDRLVAIFHDVMRAIGLDVTLSDAEVRVVLQDAFKQFGERTVDKAGAVSYSRAMVDKPGAANIPPETTPKAVGENPFKYSEVQELLYHGTQKEFDKLEPGVDGGIHFGTQAQANMRSLGKGKRIIGAYINVEKLKRVKDTGGNWQAAIRSAKSQGYDGIVYLNRYEGTTTENVVKHQGKNLDSIPDTAFKKLFPEAMDSYIVFDAKQVSTLPNPSRPPEAGGQVQYARGDAPATESRTKATIGRTAERAWAKSVVKPLERLAARGVRMALGRTSPEFQHYAERLLIQWNEFWNTGSSLPDANEWKALRAKGMGDGAQAMRFIEKLHNKLDLLADDIKMTMFRVLDGRIPVETLPETFMAERKEKGQVIREELKPREMARMIRRRSDIIGEMMLDRGMITKEQFKALQGHYIHYMYAYHVLGEGGLGISINPQTGRLDLSETMHRNPDLTEEQRKALGWIEDASIAVPVGMGKALMDIAKWDYMKQVADNPDWVWQPSLVKVPLGKKQKDGTLGNVPMTMGKLIEETKSYEKMAQDHPSPEVQQHYEILKKSLDQVTAASKNMPADFKQLPLSKSYGPLAGAFVRTAIADDLLPVLGMVDKNMGQAWAKILEVEAQAMAAFKMGKVALNPPTMFRNVISNFLQINLSGRSLPDVVMDAITAAKAMKESDPNYKYHEEAFRMGLFNTSWTATEVTNVLDAFRKAEGGRLDKVYIALKRVANFYGKIDDFFKYTMFVQQRLAGKSVDAAAVHALKWGMDYSLASRSVKVARRHFIPFISYQYKIAPLIAESLKERPWVIGKYMVLLPMLLKAWAQGENDLDDEDMLDLEKQLPEYIKKSGSMMLMPYKTDNGKWQWLNCEYFMPWGNWYNVFRDMKAGDIGELTKDIGISNPILDMISTFRSARDGSPPTHPFFGTEIYNDLDSPAMKVAKMAEHLIFTFAPSAFSPSQGALGYGIKAATGDEDRWGRKVTPAQAAGRWLGINVVTVSPDQTAAIAGAKIQELKAAQSRIEADPSISDERKQESRDRLQEKLAKTAEASPTAILPILKAKGEDPVYDALRQMVRDGTLKSTPPGRSIEIGGIPFKMTEVQYKEYLEKSSEIARTRLQPLVESPGWTTMSRERKSETVSGIVTNARKGIRQKIKAEMARDNREKIKEIQQKQRAPGGQL